MKINPCSVSLLNVIQLFNSKIGYEIRRLLFSSSFALVCLGATAVAGASQLNQEAEPENSFCYKVTGVKGVSVQPAENHSVVTGSGGFKLTLVPMEGDVWNMKQVSVLGLMLKNNGKTELVIS